MSILYLSNAGKKKGNNGSEYLRYDATTKQIQVMKQNGTWINIYQANSLPLKDYVYAYAIKHVAPNPGGDPHYYLDINQYKTNGDTTSLIQSKRIYSGDVGYNGGSYTFGHGHLIIIAPVGDNWGNVKCTVPYYVTDSSFWNNNAPYNAGNSIVISMKWFNTVTAYIRTTVVAS